jgi:hypothetical protein
LMLSQDTGQSGTSFLRPIFVIRSDKDDVLSLTRAVFSLVSDLGPQRKQCEEKEKDNFHDSFLTIQMQDFYQVVTNRGKELSGGGFHSLVTLHPCPT